LPEKNGSVGKLPPSKLARILQATVRARSPATIVPAAPGEDAGVVDVGHCHLVAHVDPITEAAKGSGRLAVIVAANDVAATGAKPAWAQLLILAPPSSSDDEILALAEEAGDAARSLGIEVLGGHTERSPGLTKPVVAAFVYGCACKQCLTPTSAAKPGHLIALVGYAGLEGMLILARDFRGLLESKGVPESVIGEALSYEEHVNIVNVAVDLAESRAVEAMHDATEGGVIGALVEVAMAAKATLRVDPTRIPVPPPLQEMAKAIAIDPLKLISSGALIAALPRDKLPRAREIAEARGRPLTVIGRVERGPPRLILEEPTGEVVYSEPPADEIARLWG